MAAGLKKAGAWTGVPVICGGVERRPAPIHHNPEALESTFITAGRRTHVPHHRGDARDGIGKEVMPEGLRARSGSRRAVARHAAAFTTVRLELRRYYAARPDDAGGLVRTFPASEAIYYGAVGWQTTVPDRRRSGVAHPVPPPGSTRYVNMRPAGWMPGVATFIREPQTCDIDFVVVRGNTGRVLVGRRAHVRGTDREFVIQESGVHAQGRRPRAALPRSSSRAHAAGEAPHVGDKSNGIAITMPYWDQSVQGGGGGLPGRPDRPVPASTSCPRRRGARSFDVVVGPTCSATSCRTRPGGLGTIRIACVSRTQSGAHAPVAVRAGAARRRTSQTGASRTRSGRSGRRADVDFRASRRSAPRRLRDQSGRSPIRKCPAARATSAEGVDRRGGRRTLRCYDPSR